jgi:hypothetical protein
MGSGWRSNLLIDLKKAYDSVDREILWELLEKRFRDESEKAVVKLMMKLYRESTKQVEENEVNTELELPQGSVSPLFYSTSTLRKLSGRLKNWRK